MERKPGDLDVPEKRRGSLKQEGEAHQDEVAEPPLAVLVGVPGDCRGGMRSEWEVRRQLQGSLKASAREGRTLKELQDDVGPEEALGAFDPSLLFFSLKTRQGHC